MNEIGDPRRSPVDMRRLPGALPATPVGESPPPVGADGVRAATRAGARLAAERPSGGGLRQMAAAAVVVGLVLIGAGLLVRTPAAEQQTLPAPPPSPPTTTATPAPPTTSATATAAGTGRLGVAPTPPGAPGTGPVSSPSDPAATTPPTTQAPPPTTPGAPPSSAAPEPVTLSFEAEDARVGGIAEECEMAAASSGVVVCRIWWGLGYVRFSDVVVDSAGEYLLTLHYASAGDRTGRVRINGGPLVTVPFPAAGDGAVEAVSLPVELEAGENEVWFGHTLGQAPDLDRITVRPAD